MQKVCVMDIRPVKGKVVRNDVLDNRHVYQDFGAL